MRIEVYRPNQDQPAHRISESLAHKICGDRLGKWLDEAKSKILLTTSLALAAIKARFQPGFITILPIREWKQGLLLSYPLRDLRSGVYR